MKISEIITQVTDLMPSQYTEERMIGWLNTVEGRIYNEIFVTHADCPRETFTPYTGCQEDLLIPAPYGEDIYIYYLESMICLQNAESAKYNQYVAMFNAKLQEFQAWWNRNHRHVKKSRMEW